MDIRKAVLWLFVINLGITFGAGLYEAIVVYPHWLVKLNGNYIWDSQAARSTDSGLRFWVYVSTFPLTLLTVVNFFFAWNSKSTLRRWWLIATALALVERTATFAYFIPTMIELTQLFTTPESTGQGLQWGRMNNFRHALNLGAWICAIQSLILTHSNPSAKKRSAGK